MQKETVVTVISKISDRPVNLDAALVVIYGLDLGRKFDLTSEETLIGRSSKADIQIDQESVSRNHASITNSREGVRIRDLAPPTARSSTTNWRRGCASCATATS